MIDEHPALERMQKRCKAGKNDSESRHYHRVFDSRLPALAITWQKTADTVASPTVYRLFIPSAIEFHNS